MILRTTKFFGLCYSDELSERQFFAKKFKVLIEKDEIQFSFDLMRGLDFKIIKDQLSSYIFFEIEDVFLRNKLIFFIKENINLKIMKINIGDHSTHIKRLKFTKQGFKFQLK